MKKVTFSTARAHWKQVLDEAQQAPILIARQRGNPVVVLSLADYDSLQETLYLLGSLNNATRLQESLQQLQQRKLINPSCHSILSYIDQLQTEDC